MSTMFRCKVIECQKAQYGNVKMHDCGTCKKEQYCHVCGGVLVEMTDDEIQAENERQRQATADAAKDARENSTLPKWCLSTISMIAYENGHSAGQQECDGIEMGMIGDFETAMRKEQNSSKSS